MRKKNRVHNHKAYQRYKRLKHSYSRRHIDMMCNNWRKFHGYPIIRAKAHYRYKQMYVYLELGFTNKVNANGMSYSIIEMQDSHKYSPMEVPILS